MRATVLGATGMAGSAIVRALVARGHEVRALVRSRPDGPREPLPEAVSVATGEIGDPASMASVAKGTDVVFVAVGAPPGLARDVYRWLYVAGFENVLAAARHAAVPRAVFVSCADVVLSDAPRVHWDEKRDLVGLPLGARARALKLAEEIALASSDAELAVTVLRPAWLWGPGDRRRLPRLVAEARRSGIDLCGNGRDLVATTYVEHLAEAALAAAVSPSAPGQAYYIADAEFLELREFLGLLCRALELPAPRRSLYPFRRLWAGLGWGALSVEEVVRRGRPTLFDTQKAARELGFVPSTTMEEGMRRLAAWYHEASKTA